MRKEYPGTLLEFERWFQTEDACRDYLIRLRWPEGFVCPLCSRRQFWRTRRGVLICGSCRKETSVTAGTVFQGIHLPLRAWFRVLWWVTNQKTGVSALGLQRLLGMGSYRTAWTCLHKLRRAMVRPGRELLTGSVEVDEIFVGGAQKGGAARTRKVLVAIAVEVRGEGMGRVRLQRVPDTTRGTLLGFVRAVVAPGSEIVTDGYGSYQGLEELGYRHFGTPQAGKGREGPKAIIPRVHRLASLLKRWLLDSHQGKASGKHLDHYLEEFGFRFNRRASERRGMLFYRLTQQCVALPPTTYKRIKTDSKWE